MANCLHQFLVVFGFAFYNFFKSFMVTEDCAVSIFK